jgi:hypothetical protein
LQKLHDATGNSNLVRDWLTGDDLHLVKYQYLNGATAINWLHWTTAGGQTTYTREIRFSEWNEASEPHNGAAVLALVHEIGHNFDDDFELSATPNNGPWVFTHFKSLSGWTDTNPNSPLYNISQDGQWWYLDSAQFYRSYSTLNPYEDWATIWELYFDETATPPPPLSNLGLKLADLQHFIGRLS